MKKKQNNKLLNKCLNCEKHKAEKDRLLKEADSIFDALVDIKEFELECSKTCGRKEEQ